jgi:hypothetical protein
MKAIEPYCDNLCLNDQLETRPFSGMVVNFCVSTDAHRDWSDNRMCLVVPFGTWEGGEIVLHELGLVIKMHSGDGLAFPSCNITHFNQHFTGLRGSLVFHSDIQGENWLKDQNGWGGHIL